MITWTRLFRPFLVTFAAVSFSWAYPIATRAEEGSQSRASADSNNRNDHPHNSELLQHPRPQFQLAPASQEIDEHDEDLVRVVTDATRWPEVNPFARPPGSNFLPTIYENMFDSLGNRMENTLPSRPIDRRKARIELDEILVGYSHPHDAYPLLAERPRVERLSSRLSPTDDLQRIFTELFCGLCGSCGQFIGEQTGERVSPAETAVPNQGEIMERLPELKKLVAEGIDILEGNSLPEWRAYQSYPLLHYNGPEKLRKVELVRDEHGKVVGGNVNVHQIRYDGRIESDTALLDLSPMAEQLGGAAEWRDLPDSWTITYQVDVMNRGMEDFSPFAIYMDHPQAQSDDSQEVQEAFRLKAMDSRDACPQEAETREELDRCGVGPYPTLPSVPHIGMDQTFWPMEDGFRYEFKIKMAHPMYFNLVYNWGWRVHPPRIQAIENAGKTVTLDGVEQTLPCFEVAEFGEVPRKNEQTKLKAISKIGELAPAKRMWNALRALRGILDAADPDITAACKQAEEARRAFWQWKHRRQLPSDVPVDPETDLTLLYANNTIYGQFSDGAENSYHEWETRGREVKITLYNGDYFRHGYMNVDFGGARGWENQFLSTQEDGDGCRFTFGRAHWSKNMKCMVVVPEAENGTVAGLGRKRVFITFNYEPSRRLRFYQFDPMHHDVAIFSVH